MLRISEPSTVADILCAILILYFLYMLYFDNLSNERGAVRQQLWAFLHFPLHLALVLAVEVGNPRGHALREWNSY